MYGTAPRRHTPRSGLAAAAARARRTQAARRRPQVFAVAAHQAVALPLARLAESARRISAAYDTTRGPLRESAPPPPPPPPPATTRAITNMITMVTPAHSGTTLQTILLNVDLRRRYKTLKHDERTQKARQYAHVFHHRSLPAFINPSYPTSPPSIHGREGDIHSFVHWFIRYSNLSHAICHI